MNSQRSDGEKEHFFYKVREGNIVTHFLRNPKCRKKQKRGGNKVLNIMYSDADGLSSKIQELQQEMKIDKPDIVCITETKLEEEMLDATLNLKGYQVWRGDRKGKKGEG